MAKRYSAAERAAALAKWADHIRRMHEMKAAGERSPIRILQYTADGLRESPPNEPKTEE